MGLPTYVWLGVIAGGLLLGLYLRSRGGSSNSTASNASYPTSLTDGLSGQSAGGNTAADTSALDSSTIADHVNGIGTLTGAVQADTEQLAGLTDVVGNVGSSGGSGASAAGMSPSDPLGHLASGGKEVSAVAKAAREAEHHKHKKTKQHH